MSQIWYYENHGRAVGPISLEALIGKIKNHEIKLVDLVFKEGEPQWLPAQSYSEITELLGSVSLQRSSEWIVLTSVNVDGQEVQKQIGPYNAGQILDLIDKGYVRFSDYVWRDGYDHWVPLGYVDQFEMPLKSSIEIDQSLYITPQRDLPVMDVPVKTVKKNVANAAEEAKPLEATGVDLTLPSWAMPLQKPISDVVMDEAVDLAPPTPEEEIHQKKNKKAERTVKPTVHTQKAFLQKMSLQEELALNQLEIDFKPPVEGVDRVYGNSTDVDELSDQEAEESLAQVESALDEGSDFKNTMQVKGLKERWFKVVIGATAVIVFTALGIFILKGTKRLTQETEQFSIKIEAPVAVPQINGAPRAVSQSVAVSDGVSNMAPPPSDPSVQSAPSVPTVQNGIASGERDISRVATAKAKNSAGVSSKNNKIKSKEAPLVGSFKNKSYYHHKERLFLFYKSAEGERLSQDLSRMAQKQNHGGKDSKSFHQSWSKKTQALVRSIEDRSQKAKVHKPLFDELLKTSRKLAAAGADLKGRAVASKKKTTSPPIKELSAQFRKITLKAKNMDK